MEDVLEWFELFYNSINSPLCVTKLDGEIVFANSKAEELFGLEHFRLKDSSLLDLVADRAKAQVRSALELVALGADKTAVGQMTMSVVRRSGREVPVEVEAKSITLENHNCVVFSFHDLSRIAQANLEREETLRALGQSTKLADIGKLTAGIAHELNNPLTIVQGFAENLQLLLHEGFKDVAELRTQVDPIVRAADRMARIISTMMKLVRSEYVLTVNFDLGEVVRTAALYFSDRISVDDIEMEFDLPKHLSAKGDPGQIEQIVINILKNAIQALETQLAPRKIRISGVNAERTELHIWNNGPEIPDSVKSRIMSPFFTTKDVGEGTGLGLALSYGIMKSHEGDLTFNSDATGTVFRLIFPKSEVFAESVQMRGSILVVDPNENHRVSTVEKLHHFGYQTSEADGGLRALEKLKTHPEVFCVFTELKMPQFDGLEFIRMAKQIKPGLLFVIVTEHSSDKTLSLRAQRQGIDGFLEKPLDPVQFSLLVNDLEKIDRRKHSA